MSDDLTMAFEAIDAAQAQLSSAALALPFEPEEPITVAGTYADLDARRRLAAIIAESKRLEALAQLLARSSARRIPAAQLANSPRRVT